MWSGDLEVMRWCLLLEAEFPLCYLVKSKVRMHCYGIPSKQSGHPWSVLFLISKNTWQEVLPEILTWSTSAESFSLLNILEIYLANAQWTEWAVYLVSLVSECKYGAKSEKLDFSKEVKAWMETKQKLWQMVLHPFFFLKYCLMGVRNEQLWFHVETCLKLRRTVG